ncbi:DNA double-strand break repair helicase HerA [uncultured archaeon]|nr:DNA double-strand break repair helicase HerA [uncultured archaeon]
MTVGQVIGSTTLNSYRFVIRSGAEKHVKREEFVSVPESVTGRPVIGIIKDIVTANELLPDEFCRDLKAAEIVLSEGEYPVPLVKVLGIEEDGSLVMPRYGIAPGSPVSLVEDETLRRLLHQDEGKSASLGQLASRDSIPVCLDINELVGKHCAVLAMTGAGKSYTVGVIIEELLAKKASIVVFDLHGEYKNIEYPPAATKVYGMDGKNKLSIPAGDLSLSDFINLIPDMTSTQKDLLDEALNIAYRFYDNYDLAVLLEILGTLYDYKKGDNKKSVNESVLPPGLLKEVTKKMGLSTIGALTRRIRRLDNMGIFNMEGAPIREIAAKNQLTVIDLSEADERVSETVVAALCRRIFNARRKNVKEEKITEGLPHPVFIVLEEAHNFAPRMAEENTPSRSILRRIAREGRKFGVGLCIVSQRSNKLDSDILSQCNTQIIMKVVNPSDQEYIRQSVESVTEDVVNDLPGLARGEAIVVGSAVKLPVPVRIRRRKTRVGGQDIDVVEAWSK